MNVLDGQPDVAYGTSLNGCQIVGPLHGQSLKVEQDFVERQKMSVVSKLATG